MTPLAVKKRPDTKAAVAAAFGAAADRYEQDAALQRDVAARLAARIAQLALPPRPRVLEIGCGTGFLSRALTALNPRDLVLSDISEAMLVRCRSFIGAHTARYLVLDGEDAAPAGADFDLICSSLAFQWFTDLPAALARLATQLAPGGRVIFATLARDTFAEWRDAHAALNLAPGVRTYPSGADLQAMLPPDGAGHIAEERLTRRYADGQAFIAHLKAIGAHLPEDNSRPLAPGALRRVLRRFETGIDVTYHVAYGIWQKS